MKLDAIAPDNIGGCKYLTPGKRYETRPGNTDMSFFLTDDEGDEILCLWSGCSHIGRRNWQRVEVLPTYTAWCREVSGTGTVWISQVSAEDVDAAIQKAREACAADWEYPVEAVECIGLAEGEVNILHWEDEP